MSVCVRRPGVITPPPVVAVVVTYGDRSRLCESVVLGALASGVAAVILVDNDSSAASRSRLDALVSGRRDRVFLTEIGYNSGSAGGFRAGIGEALKDARHDYVWLLDDDNEPRVDSLENLLECYRRKRSITPFAPLACVSFRASRGRLAALAGGVPAERVFPSRNSFLEFSPLDAMRKFLRPAVTGARSASTLTMPYSPYGGLLLDRRTVEAIGLPDSALFVYEDDTEYTSRVVRAGGSIFLCPTSCLEEIDPSWYAVSRGRFFASRLLSTSHLDRLYYQTRNRVYFEERHWVTTRWKYRLNEAVFTSTLFLVAIVLGRISTFRLLKEAIKDGRAASLGENHLLRDRAKST